MFTTSLGAAAPPVTLWATSFRGIGFRIDQLPNGLYQAVAQGGYVSPCYVDLQAALADVTAWCNQHAQGEN